MPCGMTPWTRYACEGNDTRISDLARSSDDAGERQAPLRHLNRTALDPANGSSRRLANRRGIFTPGDVARPGTSRTSRHRSKSPKSVRPEQGCDPAPAYQSPVPPWGAHRTAHGRKKLSGNLPASSASPSRSEGEMHPKFVQVAILALAMIAGPATAKVPCIDRVDSTKATGIDTARLAAAIYRGSAMH